MDLSFDGLGTHMGNVSRLSNGETRSISAENFTGAKGQGGMATEGTGSVPSRELGRGVESFTLDQYRGQDDRDPG